MGRDVPLARRNLFQDRRHAGLSVAGVAVFLLLVLVLDGILAGAVRQTTAYLRDRPADVIVAQRGVRTMHMSASSLPEDVTAAIRQVRGVAWAEPIRFTTGTLRSARGRHISYVIGYDPTSARGGPRRIVAGRAPERGGAVIDEVAADELGIGPGDRVEILGRRFRVDGLSINGTSITNTTAFVHTDDFAEIRGPAVSYVLVGARPGMSPDSLARRIGKELAEVTAQTRDDMVREEGRITRDMSADVMQIMTVVAFLIALAVVALTLFTATLSRLREYAVVKALGATTRRLAATVMAQAAWTTGLALSIALLVAFGLAELVAVATPNVRMRIEPDAIARVAAGVAAVALLGVAAPIRRLHRLDPASTFRR